MKPPHQHQIRLMKTREVQLTPLHHQNNSTIHSKTMMTTMMTTMKPPHQHHPNKLMQQGLQEKPTEPEIQDPRRQRLRLHRKIARPYSSKFALKPKKTWIQDSRAIRETNCFKGASPSEFSWILYL